jgi:L-iditol 2-dehydrogenase
MKAGVWIGNGSIECQEIEIPNVVPGTVLVQIAFCGFCGSDTHIIEGSLEIGPPPQILGHEVSGTVVEVGEGVENISAGMRVGCNLYGYCGACPWCLAGQQNHCRRKYFAANGFAEYAVYKAEQVFELPASIKLAPGALLEPVATCVHALDVSGLREGETVLVIGGGTLGQLLVQLAHMAGASQVVLSEPMDAKRDLALDLGADVAITPDNEELKRLARGSSPRRGFDVVFEVAGSIQALELAPSLLAVKGRVIIVGVFAKESQIRISPFDFYKSEIGIRGAFATLHSFPRAVAMLEKLELDRLITSIRPLEKISDAYAEHGDGRNVKLLLANADA